MEQAVQHEQGTRQILALNLSNALKVAGISSDLENPTPFKGEDLRRATRIARSTLRKLINPDCYPNHSPDLRTLCKIAQELRIPVAFLLMGRAEWQTLLAAFQAMAGEDFQKATEEQIRHGLNNPKAALQISKRAGVYPLPGTKFAQQMGGEQAAEMERNNAAFRRATLVTASLLQSAEKDVASLRALTLFAVTHANLDRARRVPPNPSQGVLDVAV